MAVKQKLVKIKQKNEFFRKRLQSVAESLSTNMTHTQIRHENKDLFIQRQLKHLLENGHCEKLFAGIEMNAKNL
jgi:hypothetical protein